MIDLKLVRIGKRYIVAKFDPKRIMAFCDCAAELAPALIGRKPHPWAQPFVADRQIRDGYMHSGYPIMTYLDVSAYQMGGSGKYAKQPDMRHENILVSGSWGHFHELGHNYQEQAWTFNNGTEVTVNLFTLYLMEQLTGQKPLSHTQLRDNIQATRMYLSNPVWSDWSKNPFVGLYTYAVPAQEFGWEAYQKAFKSYIGIEDNKLPKTDQAKLDIWMRAYSQAVGRNLVPWFKLWGAPVSKEVELELKHLAPWAGTKDWLSR